MCYSIFIMLHKPWRRASSAWNVQVYYKRGDVPDLRAYENRLLEIR